MRLNKIFIFAILFLLILNFFAISVFAAVGDNVEKLEDNVKYVESLKEKAESKWDYLGKGWYEVFLKNKFVVLVDNFLKKISFIFEILFGEPYSLSLILFFVIVLWIYFVLKFKEVMTLTAFSKITSIIISFGLVCILAQLHVLRKIIETLRDLIFAPELWWVRAIIILVIFIAVFILSKLSSGLIKKIKQNNYVRPMSLDKILSTINKCKNL